MVDYKKILQLDAAGVSGRGIADATGFARNTVRLGLSAARAQGVTFEQVADLDAASVRRLLFPEPVAVDAGRVAPDFEWVHTEMSRPNVTLLLLWGEYSATVRASDAVPYSYTSFTRGYRQWLQASGATMVFHRRPGENMEVDWAGDTMEFADPGTGLFRKAYLFVAALPFSAYFYVEAFEDMTLESWIEGHVSAFEFFGGSTRLLVPDNLKTGVTKADRYEPVLNQSYALLAEHYQTAIVPARVRKPRDKAMAENAVRHGANAVMAVLRDEVFIGLTELNGAIDREVAVINSRNFQKRVGSRMEVFLRDEKPALTPLPATRFELAELRKAKVASNYHIQVQGVFYSVPARLIGHTLDVRVTARIVEVFDGLERVAVHPRLLIKGGFQTVKEHMPPTHQAQLGQWDPERLTASAAEIGPNTQQAVAAILKAAKVVEQSFRSVLGVLALAKKDGGHQRLEDACRQALETTTTPSLTLIRRIWATWQPIEPEPTSLADAGFVRGADYYAEVAQ